MQDNDNAQDRKGQATRNGVARPNTDFALTSPPALTANAQQDFALADLRLPQNFHEGLGVKRQLVSIPVRKPDRQWWIRVHPDAAYRIDTGIIEVQEQRESYLVAPQLRGELSGDVLYKTLALATNRQGSVFLWPVRLPDPDGRLDPWNTAAREAMALAAEKWVRIAGNGTGYDVFTTIAPLPEPEWPEQSFEQLLNVAFRGRYITTANHPVLRRLRGEE